ncbi:uncharacterized protein ARMOST_07476 [Armillaria ostoyae]|uniref:Uncharacterized protein n=1 Tax=Armillaria ostoyae TaxID=47428 RepID=A0A284R5X1_ARMOS|nr:uncharacterized protein ARMOST_07476 [Armillaria ostoyae]
MNVTINLFENILGIIWLFNAVIFFIPASEEIPSYLLPVLSFVTLLVFICAAPYAAYREGNNLIFWSYFCSSFLVFNFYMRLDCGLSWIKHTLLFIVIQAINHGLFWIYCTLRKEAYAAHFFYFHACVVANFEAIYAVDLYFYAVLFSPNKGTIYEEMMQRRISIVDKVTRARRRYEYELDGDRMFDPEAGGSEHFLALGPPPPPTRLRFILTVDPDILFFKANLAYILIINAGICFLPAEEDLPSYALPLLAFITMLHFICVAPYVVYREGADILFFSYLCSSFLIFNFYMRLDYGLSWIKHTLLFIGVQAINHTLFYIYCILRKEAYTSGFFYLHTVLAAIIEDYATLPSIIYIELFSADKEAVYQKIAQRRQFIHHKIAQAHRRYENDLYGDDPEYFLELEPPPPQYVP